VVSARLNVGSVNTTRAVEFVGLYLSSTNILDAVLFQRTEKAKSTIPNLNGPRYRQRHARFPAYGPTVRVRQDRCENGRHYAADLRTGGQGHAVRRNRCEYGGRRPSGRSAGSGAAPGLAARPGRWAGGPVAIGVDLQQRVAHAPAVGILRLRRAKLHVPAEGRKLLSELAELSPVPVYVRAHNLLTTDEGPPVGLKWGSTNAYTEGR